MCVLFIINIVSSALCGVVMYNYIKVKDVRATQHPPESLPERNAKVSLLFYSMHLSLSDHYSPLKLFSISSAYESKWVMLCC